MVTDEFGKTLEKTVDFEVYFSSGGNTPIRLVGEIDCDSQSIMFNIMDYTTEEIYEGEITYSVYRRQWEQYKNSFNPTDTEFYIGDWEPVIINYSEKSFRDFNIKNGYSYEYILYTQINNIPINLNRNIIYTSYDDWSKPFYHRIRPCRSGSAVHRVCRKRSGLLLYYLGTFGIVSLTAPVLRSPELPIYIL